MARLSDFQLASLLEEIGYSMREQIPIADAMSRLQNRRLGSVAKVAGRIRDELVRGASVTQAVSHVGSSASTQASAAVEVCERNGDPRLLLRMASHLRRRAEETRSLRLAWFYPWMLLFLGYGVALFSLAPVVLRVHGRELEWPMWVYNSAQWIVENGWIPPLVLLLAFVVLTVWRQVQHGLPKATRYSLFCRSLSDQVHHGVPEDDAIRSAAALSGDAGLMSITNPSMESPEIAGLIKSVDPTEETVVMSTGQDVLVAKLRYLASNFELSARRRSYLLTRVAPRVAVIVIGGGLTIFYVFCVIAPAYQQVMQW